MKVKVGNMWYSDANIIAVTTNGSITSTHKLVMGRGAAFQAASKFPRLPNLAASVIEDTVDMIVDGYPIYGFRTVEVDGKEIGIFQVKLGFSNDAMPALIGYSIMSLVYWCSRFPKTSIALNFPGIGNGRLAPSKIMPMLEQLPNQVDIYVLSKEHLKDAT